MYANVDGIVNKVSEFNKLVSKVKPAIICLTETKLNSDINNGEIFDVECYEVFRNDRTVQNAPGGGVVILVRKTLFSNSDNVNFLNTHSYKEAVWCEIKLKSKSVLVGTIYRPPSSTSDKNKLLNDLIKLTDEYSKDSQILICGDFNYGEISWENNAVGEGDANRFLDAINDCFLYQHIMQATHNIGADNESRLDLVFTRGLMDIENVQSLAPLGKSHHATLIFDFLIDDGVEETFDNGTYKYNFHKGNYVEIRRELSEVDWEDLFSGKTALEKYEVFANTCTRLIDKHIPKVRCEKGKGKPKWMTKEVSRQIVAKERAWKRLKARKTPNRRENYRQERNKTNIMIKFAKMDFEKKLCQDIKDNPKYFWSYVRSKTKFKENVMRVIDNDGRMTENDAETANEMNKAFQSVFVSESETGDTPSLDHEYFGPTIEDVLVTVERVDKLLKGVNIHKSMGPDGIHPRLLKECHAELAIPITDIIKDTIEQGEVPALWKLAKVCPIFKKGSKSDPLNFRPVSLTSLVCKICEAIIRDVIQDHLEDNDIITSRQHGFRQRRSTLTNLLEYMEHLTKAVDLQIPVDVNYLDCKKAFDTVPHKRLLSKLHSVGIRGKILKWIGSFLSDREQFVEIRGVQSEKLNVTSGVPQGSVLGPLLFLIFINDLVDELECPTLLFADDAKIFVEINSEEDIKAMKRDLVRLEKWSEKWLLEFNANKCVTMHIGHRNPKVAYELNGEELKHSEAEKDLGVMVAENLKPEIHIGKIAAKANRMVGLIKRNFNYLNLEMCQSLYSSLVRPHLEYAVQAWSPYFEKDKQKLEKVQRRMTKLVPELKNLPYEDRCKQFNITSLEKRRLRGDLIEAFKIIHGHENVDRNIFFEMADSNTRSNTCKLKKRECIRTVTRANSFGVRVVNDWNDLPVEVVTAPSVSVFKQRLDKHWCAN